MPLPHITRMPMRRTAAAAVATALLALSLTACGDGDSSSPGGGATETKTITITFDGDTVTPNGERVDVAVGQPIQLDVTADAPGEIHVHSNPEQELEYDKGSTTLTLEPIDQPGVVDVESHHLEATIVQLEVK
jgi:endonuclease YncB( thermonuclease family)